MRRGVLSQRCRGLVPLLAVVVTLGGGVATARGENAVLPVLSISPANGATVTALPNATTEPIQFRYTTTVTNLVAYLNDIWIGGAVVSEPFGWDGGATWGTHMWSEPWATQPGTYSWGIRAHGEVRVNHCVSLEGDGQYCYETNETVYYSSPEYKFTIVAKPVTTSAPGAPITIAEPAAPVPSLTVAEAITALRSLIHARSHHSAYHLTHKCRLTGAQTATCAATWYTSQRVVGSTKIYAGTFKIDAAYEPTTVTFSGLAASVGCVARHPHATTKQCNSTVHWR